MAEKAELPPGIIIRPLTAADAVERRRLRLEALKTYPTAFGSDFEIESTRPLERFGVFPEGALFLGAFEGAHLVGMAGLVPNDMPRARHWCSIVGMYVAPAHQGSGIAEGIVQGLLADARRRFESVELSVTDGNVRARRFYERMGFKEIGRRPGANLYQGERRDEILMWQALQG